MARAFKTPHILANGTFSSALDGSHVAYRQYSFSDRPNKKIKHIILQHGAVEHHKRHLGLINALLAKYKNGVVVSCLDLVGHGYSGGTRAYVDSVDSYVADFVNFCKTQAELYYSFDVQSSHIIAHSLGGMIVLKTVVDCAEQLPFSPTSLTLVNPCIRTKLKAPQAIKDAVESIPAALGKMRIPSLYSGRDLTRDLQRAVDFDSDHLISDFVTVGMANAILKECSTMSSYSYYLETPTLFALSGNDVIVDSEACELFVAGVDKRLASVIRYPEAKHDLLNETCSSEVFREIIAFIDKMGAKKERPLNQRKTETL